MPDGSPANAWLFVEITPYQLLLRVLCGCNAGIKRDYCSATKRYITGIKYSGERVGRTDS